MKNNVSRLIRVIFPASALIALLAVSCASMKPIDEIPGVVDLDWTLREGTNSNGPTVEPTELRAGGTYYVSVRYLQRDKKGRDSWKNLINYQGVTLSASGIDWRVSGQTVLAPADPFAAFSTETASLTVRFPSGVGRDVTKNLALDIPVSLPSFRGADGAAGADGSGSSTDGGDGKDGKNGADLELEVARYDLAGTRFESSGYAILVYDIRSNRTWLLGRRSSAIALDASGGTGGDGGRGLDRSIAEGSSDTFLRGGDGGDGGNGGNGGLVRMILPEGSSLNLAFSVNVARGEGGKGGYGGDGDRKQSDNLLVEIVSTLMVNGSNGDDGMAGATGRYLKETKSLDAMFLGVMSPLFDRSRLAP